jgi:sterol desaturase/sphingolipid hydroxylase (fatty acid hydroxylase superfamily)
MAFKAWSIGMIRSIVIHIVNSPVLHFGAFFLLRACLWVAIETLWRARSVPYRQVATKDFAAEIFHVFLVIPVVLYLYDRLFAYHPFPQAIQSLPMVLRIALYLLIADFGYYWAHRLMHTGVLWRTHKWHHSPTYMYWLAGCRATISQQFLVGVPYVLVTPILYPSPWWVYTALVIFSYLTVDWMHLNVSWGTRWLEWFIVTPRYHHIHHSSNPEHYELNLGNNFTFWDRLFGTYFDPDTLETKEIVFGIGETPSLARLIAGV